MPLSPSLFIKSRKVPVYVGTAVTFLVIIALLTTRQILTRNAMSETVLFLATIIVCYGVGSWFLLKYTHQASRELRAKSPLIQFMHFSMVIVQFLLLGILVLVLFSDARFLPTFVYALSSASAAIIMVLISFKFLSWFRANTKNVTVLFFGLTAAALAIAIANDAGSKLLLVKVVEEPTPPGAVLGSTFVYRNDDKYQGNVQYKVVDADTTLTYVVPYQDYQLYRTINFISLFPYVFTWVSTTALLYRYYRRIGRFPIRYWVILCIPLGFYLLGSNLVLSLPSDSPYVDYYRLLFRIGTVGSSVLFGLAFFVVTRRIPESHEISSRIKGYLTISAIGIVLIGLSLSTSALQQTYGIAAHSLVLLASYLFTVGFYSSALLISQDSSLRRSIRKYAQDLLGDIGAAQMEKELKARTTKLMDENQRTVRKETGGISYPSNESEASEYINELMKEIKQGNFPARKVRYSDNDSTAGSL